MRRILHAAVRVRNICRHAGAVVFALASGQPGERAASYSRSSKNERFPLLTRCEPQPPPPRLRPSREREHGVQPGGRAATRLVPTAISPLMWGLPSRAPYIMLLMQSCYPRTRSCQQGRIRRQALHTLPMRRAWHRHPAQLEFEIFLCAPPPRPRSVNSFRSASCCFSRSQRSNSATAGRSSQSD